MKSSPLPAPAESLLPHSRPMAYIDRLLETNDGRGLSETRLGPDHMLVDEDGRLDRVAFIELAAQCFAAQKGWNYLTREIPTSIGYLVGVQGFECFADARAGDLLLIETVENGVFDGFSVVEATITRGSETLCQGKLKLYIPENETADEKEIG